MTVCFSQRRLPCFLLLAFAASLLCLPQIAFAAQGAGEPSSGMLVDEPMAYDGREIRFRGEAIGEAMVRGDNAWLHLNDDAYMYENVEEGAELGGYNSGMPVWLSRRLADRVEVFGDYKHEGDVVEVGGVFNAACAQHGGDMDIHADELVVTVPGHVAADPIKPWKLPLGLVLALAAGLAFAAERRLGYRELSGVFRRRR